MTALCMMCVCTLCINVSDQIQTDRMWTEVLYATTDNCYEWNKKTLIILNYNNCIFLKYWGQQPKCTCSAVRVDFIDLLSSGSQYFLPYVISHPHWITAVGISHFAVHNVRRIRINKIDGSYHQYTMTDRDDWMHLRGTQTKNIWISQCYQSISIKMSSTNNY